MKLENQAMKEILEILNPVRLLTCDEWMRIAGIKADEGIINCGSSENVKRFYFYELQSRFEKLVRGEWVENDIETGSFSYRKVWIPALLTKERFVCEVEEPEDEKCPKHFYLLADETCKCRAIKTYEDAQSKLLFDEFRLEGTTVFKDRTDFEIWFENTTRIWFNGSDDVGLLNPTVFDFIIELDRYNRTAKEPIKIMWTPQFLTQLLND